MSEVENISFSQSELEVFIQDFGEKINGYLSGLKKKSSDEILNGSVQKAQKLLDKIVLVEEGVDKVASAHEYLLALLEQSENGNIDSNYINEKFKGKIKSDSISEGEAQKRINGKFRIPLLKALIYLGGSSEEDEMIEYIKKESTKILSKDEIDSDSDGAESTWISELRDQCAVMKDENLLKFDESRNQWEITQKGIDCLAKNDK